LPKYDHQLTMNYAKPDVSIPSIMLVA
jgi:hypothetical protein